MLKFFRNKYRVVVDKYLGYEAQVKFWWLPVWVQVDGGNTNKTIEQAENLCKRHANNRKVVKYVEAN